MSAKRYEKFFKDFKSDAASSDYSLDRCMSGLGSQKSKQQDSYQRKNSKKVKIKDLSNRKASPLSNTTKAFKLIDQGAAVRQVGQRTFSLSNAFKQ